MSVDLAELREEARLLFERFSPYLDDDNDWYRGGHFDGKDAQCLAEFAGSVMQVLAPVPAADAALRERIKVAIGQGRTTNYAGSTGVGSDGSAPLGMVMGFDIDQATEAVLRAIAGES